VTDKRIIVHSLAEAEAAVAAAAELGAAVTLQSGPGMATFMGPMWFKALIDEAVATHPGAPVAAMLDCADEPGTVLAALRAGLRRARFTGAEETRARLDAIARQMGATVEGEDEAPTLDLLDLRDPAAAARQFLARD
jgi:fructose/tagatose bisphosphate aldolase